MIKFKLTLNFIILCTAVFIFPLHALPQKLAVLKAENSAITVSFAERLHDSLSTGTVVLDTSMSETAFRSATVENVLNMTAAEARGVAAVIGCDYFLITKAGSLRRSSFEKAEYYEAFGVVYLVSGRTGRLSHWELRSLESDSAAGSEKMLLRSAGDISALLIEKMKTTTKAELSEKPIPAMEEVPAENPAGNKAFRPPMPYKRVKPEYTSIAYLYDAKGTVDVLVDINENGTVTRSEIVRWAGYGLDGTVEDAVRKMNWRPADRNGKPLPMRVLLRYNFTKVDKQ